MSPVRAHLKLQLLHFVILLHRGRYALCLTVGLVKVHDSGRVVVLVFELRTGKRRSKREDAAIGM